MRIRGTVDRHHVRATWDALAAGDTERFVGDPERGRHELEALFGRLGADPRGGLCVEVGCGPGRMTAALAERFDHVVAVDVSPEMLARAGRATESANVEFRLVSGERLDSVEDGCAETLVCYLVLQHLPSRRHVVAYLSEFARVLAPAGQAFVQLPVLEPGLRARLWRAARTALLPLLPRGPERSPALRGFRLSEPELERGLVTARLAPTASDVGPHAPYRWSRDLFLRLEHA